MALTKPKHCVALALIATRTKTECSEIARAANNQDRRYYDWGYPQYDSKNH